MVNEPLSKWTIHTVLITTRQFFRWCAREKLIKVDPALELKLPPEPDVEPKPISAATFAKLVKTATTMGEFWEQARNVALLYCLRDTGGRIGGLLNARLDDLDLKAGLLTVCEKGNRMRDLPLNDPVRAALRQWLKVRAHARSGDRSSVYRTARAAVDAQQPLFHSGAAQSGRTHSGPAESPFISPRVCARCPAQRRQHW